mmetsp:Transcript_21208/g.49332  ORF Transcript_21208/g.49332 Transcript_21208/m.49332 type:complete len:255 (+) Transcript_21208:85-849(+)
MRAAGGPSGDTSSAPVLDELPQPLQSSKVPKFLEPYGYVASSSLEWFQAPLPELTIQVKGHHKAGGQTYYDMECSLAKSGQWQDPYLTWRSSLRLAQLREGLHDQVKRELGSAYRDCFDGVHFAHRYAPAGTTARLDTWCRKLAASINSKQVTPAVAACTLQLLGAPSGETIGGSGEQHRNSNSPVPLGEQDGLAASPGFPLPMPESSECTEDDLNPFNEDLNAELAAGDGTVLGNGAANSPQAGPPLFLGTGF